MEIKEFNSMLENRLTSTRDVLIRKKKEYAPGADRLEQFKNAGTYLQTSPEFACLAFATKHLTSLRDLVLGLSTIVEEDKAKAIELVDEKIGDTIAYMVLLEGLLKERIELTEGVLNDKVRVSPVSRKSRRSRKALGDSAEQKPVNNPLPIVQSETIDMFWSK